MAKVTLVIEDIESPEGQSTVTISGDFDQPGKSYEEMTANPTHAVALGLRLLADAMQGAEKFTGHMRDEFGNTKDFEQTR